MVFNATFNKISIISWQSVLLVEEFRVLRENHRPATSHWQTLSHNVVYQVHLVWTGFELTTSVVIETDCIGSCKSYYHMIATMTARILNKKDTNVNEQARLSYFTLRHKIP